MSKAACIFAFLMAAACAMGGSVTPRDSSSGPVDGAPKHDGQQHVWMDASVTQHDAAVVVHDAFVPKDAPVGGEGSICTDNTNCGSGTCCFVAICVLGTPIGANLCIPQ